MVTKATFVLIASGLAGSGIFALTGSPDEPQRAAAVPTIPAPEVMTTASIDPASETFQRAQLQANLAAQRPFAGLTPAVRRD